MDITGRSKNGRFLHRLVFYSLDSKWRQCLRQTVGQSFCFSSICWLVYTEKCLVLLLQPAAEGSKPPTAFAANMPLTAGCSRTQTNVQMRHASAQLCINLSETICMPSIQTFDARVTIVCLKTQGNDYFSAMYKVIRFLLLCLVFDSCIYSNASATLFLSKAPHVYYD